MTRTTSQSVNPNQLLPPGIESVLISPAGVGLLACGAVIVVAKYIDALVGKSKLATARWGRTRE
ncbi:MAG: type IV secretory system conjugative DNA transfer family protein, partial [Nostoc sp.]